MSIHPTSRRRSHHLSFKFTFLSLFSLSLLLFIAFPRSSKPLPNLTEQQLDKDGETLLRLVEIGKESHRETHESDSTSDSEMVDDPELVVQSQYGEKEEVGKPDLGMNDGKGVFDGVPLIVEDEDEDVSSKLDSEMELLNGGKGLTECKRTMLFKFANLHGFGSEITLFLRLHALARHHHYTLLIDSSTFNYGPWLTYFLPPVISCVPPPPTIPRTRMRFPKNRSKLQPEWLKRDHVKWHRDLDGLDDFFVDTFVEVGEVKEMRSDGEEGLTSEETIPVAFRRAYQELQKSAKEVWKPNKELELMIGDLEGHLGLVEEEVSELVAVHVRLGDKYLELGPNHGPGLQSDAINTYFNAAKAVLSTSSDRKKPVLALMSDDPDAWKLFKEREEESGFEVVGTGAMMEGGKEKDAFRKKGGFHETAFNKLPLAERIALTKPFVRDLTLLSQSANGLIITGSSNVGRLMALLAEEAVEEGKLRSVDVRWFPTARFL